MSHLSLTHRGFATYIARGFTHRAGTAAAYTALLVYAAMLAAMYGVFAVFTQQVLNQYLNLDLSWEVITLLAIALMGFLAYNRVEFSTRLMATLLCCEVVAILILDLAILFQGGEGGGATLSFVGFAPSSVFTSGLGLAFLFALASFGGFEATVVYSEEVRTPRRTVPLATYAAVASIGIFYAFSTWAIANGSGVDNVQEAALNDPVGFIFGLSDTYVGGWLTDVMSILSVTSFGAILLGFTNILSRYTFAMGRVGVLPRWVAQTHHTHQSPHRASMVTSITALTITGAFMLGGADPFTTLYTLLLAVATVGLLAITGVTSISTIAFFRPDQRGEGLWRTTIAPAISTVGFVVAVYLALDNYDLLTGNRGGVSEWLWVLLPIAAALGYVVGVVRGPDKINFLIAEADPFAPDLFDTEDAQTLTPLDSDTVASETAPE